MAKPKPDFKWPISVSRLISTPGSKVWEVISKPGNLDLCHPFCEQNPVESWQGIGSLDEIHYLNGRILQRRVVNWIEGIGYDLEVGRPNGRHNFVSWRIIAVDEGQSILRIVIYPPTLQNLPVLIRWLPYLIYLKPHLKRYLESVTGGFAWFLETGKPVSKNQFGPHPWFSTSK